MPILAKISIRAILALLVLLALLPASLIILYSGLELRREAIANAQREVLFLAQTMGEVQKGITQGVHQVLATLAQSNSVRLMDRNLTGPILSAVVENNPNFVNVTALDVHGEVFASGRPFGPTNLADRAHIQQALAEKQLSVSHYITSRVGVSVPTIAFAYPVLNMEGYPLGVVAATLNLENYVNLFNLAAFPPNSFAAVTDGNGIRLFYYPTQEETNPLGRPIAPVAWEAARDIKAAGISVHAGSDGVRRIFAFQPVRLEGGAEPYMYMWAGIPEALVLKPANRILVRNLVFVLVSTALALMISWLLARKTFLGPIRALVDTARDFGGGNTRARADLPAAPKELNLLGAAFDNMADELVENQERLGTIADYTYDWEYWIGPDNRLLWVSPSCARMTGYSPAEFLNDEGLIERIVHDQDKERFQDHLVHEASQCKANPVDFRIVHKSGHIVWVNHHCLPIMRTDGSFQGRRASNRDITDRKQAEHKLRESEAQFRSLVEGAPDAIYVQDSQCRFVYLNAAALRLFGAETADQLIGQPILDRFHPDFHTQIRERIRLLHVARKAVPRQERICLRLDGQPVSVESSAVPVVFGGQDWSLVFLQDISERKQIEVRLQQAQKMEAIGALAGGIAHDFNNILFPIMGLSEMLLEDLPAGSFERANVAEIYKAGQRASDLVNQILSFSRQTEHKKIPIHVQQVLKEVVRLVRATIPTNITIEHHLQKECSPVLADPTNLHQVAMNLITNAYHAVEQTGGTIIIELRQVDLSPEDMAHLSLPPGRYALMTVSDTGHGIPTAVIANIFDPYFTTKPQGKGTGLGLSVVYGIVREHGGDVRVYSEAGKGAVFKVYLPALARDEEVATVPVRIHPTGSERILLVDDEEPIVRMGKQMLERLGYHVATRTSSTDALAAFEANPAGYDLVVTDMAMPNMTGEQLANKMMTIRPDIPIIICTGFSERISAFNARQSGIKGFLMKPLVRGDLASMVRRVLDEACQSD